MDDASYLNAVVLLGLFFASKSTLGSNGGMICSRRFGLVVVTVLLAIRLPHGVQTPPNTVVSIATAKVPAAKLHSAAVKS